MELYHLYIIYSSKLDRYYVGHTHDLEDRLAGHNSGKTNYTRKGIPWEMVYCEEFETKSLAYKREIEVKKMKSRKYIESLFKKDS